MDVGDYRRTSHEVWQAMAPGWERWRAELADALAPVRVAGSGAWATPRETVLELGAGTGETGFAAAAILGEDGRLISTDFAPEMVEVARRRGTELGLGNVVYRVIDAEQIEPGLRLGRRRALPEHLHAGGRSGRGARRDAPGAETGRPVGALGWGAPDRNPWASIGGMVLVERGQMTRPEPGAPGSSAWERGAHQALLAGAGFRSVRMEDVTVHFSFRDLDDYERWIIDVGARSRWRCGALRG